MRTEFVCTCQPDSSQRLTFYPIRLFLSHPSIHLPTILPSVCAFYFLYSLKVICRRDIPRALSTSVYYEIKRTHSLV